MITVLYAKEKSLYKSFDCDVYDINRNALSFQGKNTVIAHPPCDHWARLKAFTKKPKFEKYLALHALWTIEMNGGILEHPAGSQIWKLIKANTRAYSGFLMSVNLSWFGYSAQKRTTLYIKGITRSCIPAHPLSFDAITHKIGGGRKGELKDLPKKMRDETPEVMCKWLLEIAYKIEHNRLITGNKTAIDRDVT